jgi:hypothetical protein
MKTKNEMFATMTSREYSRTASGKSWKSKPDAVEEKEITREHFDNFTDEKTIKFFRRLGGAETVTRCYTSGGNIPYEISSISPDRTIKKVRTFQVIADIRK